MFQRRLREVIVRERENRTAVRAETKLTESSAKENETEKSLFPCPEEKSLRS